MDPTGDAKGSMLAHAERPLEKPGSKEVTTPLPTPGFRDLFRTFIPVLAILPTKNLGSIIPAQ